MTEKSKRVPRFERLPSWLPWLSVLVIIIAGVVYAAHENQMRADTIITQLSSELALAKAELKLAITNLETAKEELEQSNTALAAAQVEIGDAIAVSEKAIVADLFEPLIMTEWRGALIDTGVFAETCADLPIGIGFDKYLGFNSLLLGGTESYIRYNLRSDFANPLKASGRYEKVNDLTYVRKDLIDARESQPHQFVDNYCRSLELRQ